MQVLFYHIAPAIFFLLHFFSQYHFPVYTFKTLSTCALKFSKETIISLELAKSHSIAFHHENKLSRGSGLPLCGPCTHIICITFLTKVSTIAITLLLFLLTSTTFPDISSFTKIPTPPNLASFPDHHSLYLCYKILTKRAPWPFHLTSWMQHTSTLLFLNSSHTLVFLPQRLPTFNVPNLIP